MTDWTKPQGWGQYYRIMASRFDSEVRDNLRAGLVWEEFDPEPWTTTGNAPVSLGTGGVKSGRWARINDVIIAEIYIYWGTSADFGTGFYTFKLPVRAKGPYGTWGQCIGSAGAVDNSTTYSYSAVCRLTADNTVATYDRFYVTHGSGTSAWGATTPVTWASGDSWSMTLVYEAEGASPNLLSTQDSGLEGSGIGTWQGYSTVPTLTNSTTRATLGTHSLQVTWPTASSGNSGAMCYKASGLIPGETYVFSCDVWVPTGSPRVFARSPYRTLVYPVGWPYVSTVYDAWQRIAGAFVATSTAEYVGVVTGAASDAGDLMWIDNARLELGLDPTPAPFNATASRSWKAGERPSWETMNAQIRDRVGSLGQWHEHTWVPTWTSTGTAPSLGNGTITGRYTVVGKTVFANLRLTMGSTTTYGTGQYIFSLPVARYNTGASSWPVLGVALLGDTGTADYGAVARHGTTTSNCILDTPVASVSPTVPHTWASTDVLDINFCYEAA